MTAGVHEIVVTFVERGRAATDEAIFGFTPYGGFSYQGQMRVPRLIGGVELKGPYSPTGVSHTASRDKIFVCTPAAASEERACAEKIAATLARRAFRRPLGADDVARLMPFYDAGRKSGSFDSGVEQLVTAILASPDFLYRAIEPPAGALGEGRTRPAARNRRARRAVALGGPPLPRSRSTTSRSRHDSPSSCGTRVPTTSCSRSPSAARCTSRARSTRRSTGCSPTRARRRSSRASRSSGSTSTTSRRSCPTRRSSPSSATRCARTSRAEIELFLKSVLLDNHDVRELLTSDQTFLNERLARHYGVAGVHGPQFRRVKLDDPARFGLLGKGAVLLRTSYGDRTSPVLRGAWVLDKLMGTPPTPPPPNVVVDLTQKAGEKPKTLRARLERHRTDAGLQRLPQRDRPVRARARELHRHRAVAHGRPRGARADRRGIDARDGHSP